MDPLDESMASVHGRRGADEVSVRQDPRVALGVGDEASPRVPHHQVEDPLLGERLVDDARSRPDDELPLQLLIKSQYILLSVHHTVIKLSIS